MRLRWKWLGVLFALSFITGWLSAQMTTITGIITDSTGTPWAGALVTASFSPTPGFSGKYNWNGQQMTTFPPVNVTADSSGHFTMSVPDSALITPAQTGRTFTFCPLASVVCNTSGKIPVPGPSVDITGLAHQTVVQPQFNPTGIQYGYNDAEVLPIPGIGQVYYRTSDGHFRQWDGSAWVDVGGGGGGSGNVQPGLQGLLAGYPLSGTSDTVGPGLTTLDYVTPFLQGQMNTDLYASGGGNNGVANALATCGSTGCFLMTPPYSVDTETRWPQSKPSVWFSYANNAVMENYTNPAVNNQLFSSAFASANISSVVYNTTNPSSLSAPLGSSQMVDYQYNEFDAPGFSNGITGCPLFCPPAGYSDVANWSTPTGHDYWNIFRGAGIRNAQDTNTQCLGVGDCQGGFGDVRTVVEGGYTAPSDEGVHELGSIHSDTLPDFEGVISTITNPTHLFVTPSVANGSQGQLRFLLDVSRQVFATKPISFIHAPGDGHPYGTVVFNSSAPTIPTSNFTGTAAGDCTIPVQTNGMASASCTFNVLTGAIDTTHIFCSAANHGNLFNTGVQVTAVGTVSATQTATVIIRRSIPNGAYVFQGGACGMFIDMDGDILNNGTVAGGNPIHGSAFPLIGSIPDGSGSGITHTAVYVNYQSSQVWAAIPNPGSFSFSQALAGVPGNGINGGSFSLSGVSRTGGIVTATVVSGNQSATPPSLALNLASYFTISGCSDSSVNGLVSGVHVGALGGSNMNTFTFGQAGANTTCSSGATVTLQHVTADLDWGAEVYDVVNRTPGTPPAVEVDGTFATSYQPNFQVGDAVDMPPNYSMSSDGVFIVRELVQPNLGNNTIDIILDNFSGLTGSAINIVNAVSQEAVVSAAGSSYPTNILHYAGFYTNGLVLDFPPLPGSCVLCIGFPTGIGGAWNGRYNVIAIDAAFDRLAWDDTAKTFSFFINNADTVDMSPTGTSQHGQNMLQNAQFEGIDPISFAFTPYTQFREISVRLGYKTPAYDTALDTPPTITNVGTPGSTMYNYWIAVTTPYGVSWTPRAFTSTGNATLNGSNFNQISCSVIPTGTTGSVYTYINPLFYLVNNTAGQCTSPAATVSDTGANGVGISDDVISLGGGLFAGSHIANGNKGGFAFTQNDNFNDAGSPITIDSWLTHPSSHTWSFDGSTKGDHLGNVLMNNLTVASCTGCGAGSSFITSLTTTGTSGAATVTSGVLNIPIYSSGSGGPTLETNGSANASQVLLNFLTSTVNTTGLTATPVNSGGTEKFEISGTINAANVATLNQNTTGTAANLSGTPALPNGTTATTQTVGDSSTKIATDAFVLANVGGGIANITVVMPTSSIGANSCTSPATATMTGLLTSSVIDVAFTTNPTAVNGWGNIGGLVFAPWPTANTLNWSVCNQTTSAITPGAMTLNVGAR